MPGRFSRLRALGRLRALAAVLAAVLATGFAGTLPGADALAERIESILDRPAARRASWGIAAVSLDDSSPIYQKNADKLFVPASNAKLYSSALGLTRLGAEHQFTTVVVAETPLGENGVIEGNLRLIGGGDPNLSSRVIPYDPKAEFHADRMAPMKQLAEQIVESGVRRIEGELIGDDRRYVWRPYPTGWSLDDPTWSYGAPVSALSFNDNAIEILVRPGRGTSRPARLRIEPDLGYYEIRNKTRTAPTRTVASNLGLERLPATRVLTLWGEISIRSPGRTLSIAVDDPPLFAAMALRGELEKLGVEIVGGARADHADPSRFPNLRRMPPRPAKRYPETLAVLASAPLAERLRVMNKLSINLHAEMLLREVGYVVRGVGSREAGIEEMRVFLKQAGLSPWEFFLRDASGLSRHNLVTAAGTVKLLRYMWDSPNRDVYLDSLPLAGVDGTLDWRFSRSRAKGRVRAKTGTLTHATALAGYITTRDGRNLAFAVFVNNFGVSASYIRNLVDRIVVELVDSKPPQS